MVVYLDLLLLVNFAFNFLLVGAVALASPVPAKLSRLLAAALAGTAFYLIFFWFNQYIFIEWTCRLLGALSMAAILSNQLALGKLVGKGLMLLVTGQLLGGGIISIFLWSRGVVYGSMPLDGLPLPGLLLAAAGMTLLAAWGLKAYAHNKRIKSYTGTITATVAGVSKSFSCLLDSGNCLKNPVNGWPVVILSAQAARELFPPELLSWFFNYESLPPPDWQGFVTLVPYRVVGSFGLLPAVKPQGVIINDGHQSVKLSKVYLAVRGEEEKMPDYQAIAFPVHNREEGEENDKLTG